MVTRLRDAFPKHAIVAEEGGGHETDLAIPLARRSAGWDHEFRARLSLFRGLDWP